MYRQTRGAASRILAESVAEIGVNEADCYIRASNSFPGFLPRSWSGGGYEVGKAEHGCEGAPRDGSVSRSICVLALPPAAPAQPRTGAPDAAGERGRSFGPGCEARASSSLAARRSALSPGDGRWSPRQLFPSRRFAAIHGFAALARECAQAQRGIRPPIGPRRDATPYRLSFFRPLPCSAGGVQEFELVTEWREA